MQEKIMSEITVVSFETSLSSSDMYVSELSDGPPFTVHGIALGAGDVTVGQSGVKKKWPADELKEAADSLKGTNLVVDHNNDATGVVGRVTKAGYRENTGVVYEAELYDEDLGAKVKNGLLEVSIRGYHADVDSLEEEEETGAKVVEDIKFDNLSIVPTGAAPSNTLEMGEHAELSAAELKQFTGTLNEAALETVEPGMWVEGDGIKGITISQVQDGEIEVDIYEEMDGKWRSTEKTEMVSTDSLDEWDVDEEEDIGAVKKDEDESEEENMPLIEPGMKFFDSVNNSTMVIKSIGGNMATVTTEDEEQNDSWKEEIENIIQKLGDDEWEHAGHVDEMGRSNVSEYDVESEQWVQWYPSDTTEEHGFVLDVDGSGDEATVTIEVWTQDSDGKWETDGEEITKKMEEVEPWGNFPREQEEFSDAIDGDDPRRAVKPSSEENASSDELISSEVENALKEKVEEHNEEYGDDEGKRVTYRMLKNVFKRGMGAYQDSHREGMTAQQWSYARVNAFLYLVRNGNPENDQYTQDNDLLPEEHSKYNETSEEENAAAKLMPESGDLVKWKGVNDEMLYGQIVSISQDGNQMVAEIRRHTEGGELLDEIVEKPIQGIDKWDKMDSSSPDDMRDDSPSVEAPTWEDGQMVKWQVNPKMMGKIVHVDREKKVLMVEVMESSEQGLQPTGYTLTAGYQDVIPMDKEMAAVTTSDMPTQDAQPNHKTDSVNNLLGRFVESHSGSEPSLSDFIDWMNEENLSINRTEGEEESFQTEAERKSSNEGEPHRFIDAEDEQLAETYSDYPEAAKENAQMALDAKEETDNPNDCGTSVGWRRAKQLANGEAITRKQLGKMSAFNRHRSNSDMDDDEGRADCGWMMWKAWGGDEGVDWAKRKLDSIEEENAMYDVPNDHMFKSKEDAMEKAKELGLNGVHEMDGKWMPGENHEEYMDNVSSNSKHSSDEDEEEMASVESMENVLEVVNSFLESDKGAEDEPVNTLLDWGDSEAPVEEIVDMFIDEASNDVSKESDVRAFMEWINGELTNKREAENSVDEGDTASDAEEELQDYEMHTPDWSGTTEQDWSRPDLDDFDTDDLSEVAKHFLISSSGFPPENYTDLKLPIVEPNGDLNVNALAAVKGGRGASAVDGLSSEKEEKIMEMMNKLANEEFDRDWGMEENAQAKAHDSQTAGRPTPGENTVGGVRVLSGDDLQQSRKSEESDADSLKTYTITTMTSNIEEKLSELDEPVAVEAEEVEELRNKADRFEEMSENLEALRERTDILDDVSREQVEELAESEDAVVVESARFEELSSEAEQVKGVYAAQLAEHYDAFDEEELTDKFSIEELREKYEAQFGSVEDLASSDEAEPRSQDADEESLEDAAEESEPSEEEELADEAAAKQEELRDKILGGR